MFGIVNKLKAFKEVLSEKLSNVVDDLTDDGYEVEKTEDNEIKITESDDYDIDDIEEKFEEEFPESEDIEIGGGGGSWLPEYFKFKHSDDRRVCDDCRGFGDIYVNKLELRRDGTGNLHSGGDEDVIEFLLKDSAYTVQDLALQPSTVPLNLHVSQKGAPEYIDNCRCVLMHITQ